MTNDEKNTGELIQIKKREDVCPSKKLDLNVVRERIDAATAHDAAEKTGPENWRSLEELPAPKNSKTPCTANSPKAPPSGSTPFPAADFSRSWVPRSALAGMTAARVQSAGADRSVCPPT